MGRPFFYIVKSLGLACYTVDTKTKCLRTTCFDKLLLVCTSSVWILSVFIQVSRITSVEFDFGIDSIIIDTLWYYQIVFQHYLGLGVVIFSFTQKAVVEKCLKTIFDFDEKLKNLGWHTKSEKRLFITVVLAFIAGLIATSIYAIIFVIKEEWSKQLAVASIVYNTADSCYILFFFLAIAQMVIISVFCIRDRLTSIIINLR